MQQPRPRGEASRSGSFGMRSRHTSNHASVFEHGSWRVRNCEHWQMRMPLALASAALVSVAVPAGAQASRSCGHVRSSRYGGAPVAVSVFSGATSCSAARKVASRFQDGNRGKFYGIDLASGYWLVDGWKCQSGTDGGSGCSRGPHNLITMQADQGPSG